MWTKSYSTVTTAVTKEQMWNLMADVNNWASWDDSIEFAKLEGKFEQGNYFTLRPKGGPNVKIKLLETIVNKRFLDFTKFPLAKMYGDHTFEETPNGLKITSSISVEGILSFVWIKLVAQNIANTLQRDIERQIQAARKL